MTTPLNTPYLRNQRQFPLDSPQALSVEIDKMYIDVAQKMNDRIIGIFSTNRPVINGEAWYLDGGNRKKQALRQAYPFTFTTSPFDITHGINLSQISGFTRIWGTFVDTAGIWYPLPYVDVTSVTNQVSLIVNSTEIVITKGAGAPPPIASGFVVLEWLSAGFSN